MWQKFVDWLKSLFGSEDSVSFLEEEQKFSFTGVIKDDADSRDQVFQPEVK
jgi:hypothetical protein